MDDLTRRGALALAATAGVAALAAADEKKDEKPKEEEPKKAMTDKDRALDRERVIACGMTEAEADCWVVVAKAAGQFFDLPKLHPMDDHEVAHAIHIIQHKLLSRPAYRRYKESFKAEKK